MIELNKIAANLDVSFKKSPLISKYETILALKKAHTYKEAFQIFLAIEPTSATTIDDNSYSSIVAFALSLRMTMVLDPTTACGENPDELLPLIVHVMEKAMSIAAKAREIAREKQRLVISSIVDSSSSATFWEILIDRGNGQLWSTIGRNSSSPNCVTTAASSSSS